MQRPEVGSSPGASAPSAFVFAPGVLEEAYGPVEGVREMLAALSTAGYALGVLVRERNGSGPASNSHPQDMIEIQVPGPADDPAVHRAALLSAAERLGVHPSEVAYVVSSAAGVEAGGLAGTRVALALWPRRPSSDLEAISPVGAAGAADWTLERPADLTRRFARWC